MKKSVGLAAAAAAASFGTAAFDPARAATTVGSVYVSANSGDPTITIYNTSSNAFTGAIYLEATWDGGKHHARTTLGTNIAASSSLQFKFPKATPSGTSPFVAYSSRPASVTSGIKFQVVDPSMYLASGQFGSPVGGVDWLGIKTSGGTGSALASNVMVPEPATMLVLAGGLIGLGAARRRRA
jgi:hypothetical protein